MSFGNSKVIGVAMSKENGVGVCSWDEWKDLSEEAQKYELHRILQMLDQRTKSLHVYAFTGGIVGGVVAVFSIFSIKLTVF